MYNPLNPPSVDFNRDQPDNDVIAADVRRALEEDLGDGDRTAALIDVDRQCTAQLVSRESAVMCGSAWFEAVFAAVDSAVTYSWTCRDGDYVRPEQTLVTITGPARSILSGERTALNFLQLLSGVATETRRYVDKVKGTQAKIVDTRKTLPNLRTAQKYAVRCGGGINHRFGLFDAVMLKENHLAAGSGIAEAIMAARMQYADVPVIAEAEDLAQVEAALSCPAPPDILLLDDFPTHLLARAVNMGKKLARPPNRTLLEASGGIDLNNVRDAADTGVDRISIGGLTKHVQAVDLSLRVDDV